MSRVVCPECFGRCCRLHGTHGGGAYVQHTEDPEEDFSRHICPACWDGTVPASSIVPTTAPTPRVDERAAIVAYLRYQAEVFVDDERALCRVAADIERGEHRREEER